MSTSVRARFWVQSIKRTTVSGNELAREVILAPVVRPTTVPGAEGNVDWSKYTPSGEIRLVITAQPAGEAFEAAQIRGDDVEILMNFVPKDQ